MKVRRERAQTPRETGKSKGRKKNPLARQEAHRDGASRCCDGEIMERAGKEIVFPSKVSTEGTDSLHFSIEALVLVSE